MTYNNRGANHYKNMQITTANRGQILIMLYEAAIKNCKHAIIAIERKDILTKGKMIGKTMDIVNELNNSLDHKVGGKVSADLEQLYNFMNELLTKANIENKAEHLHEVAKLLGTLLEGWKGAVAAVNSQGGLKPPTGA